MGRRNCFILYVFLVITLALSGMLFGQRVIDLNKVWGDMRVLGDDYFGHSGRAVAYGDINGDGYMDVIIGYESVDSGETYVIFGHSSPVSTIDLSIKSADITICGDDIYGRFGWAVASGDVNDDGFDDIIIGAYRADSGTPAREDAGKTYVIFGASFSSPPYTIQLDSQPADITIYGNEAYDGSGWAVASGYINGDVYADIVIGAPFADPSGGSAAGETYVIFGSSSPPSTVDLSTTPADITVCGKNYYHNSGYAVSSGNINKDGFTDIIIGAPGANPSGGGSAGETYVIFGSSSPPSTIDLSTESADITICGDNYCDKIGHAVVSGDVNADGYEDIIIGAPTCWDPWGGVSGTGKTHVIYGSSYPSPPYTIDLNTQSANITIYADDRRDWLGNTVASGDINGDGYMDIIIGARYADPGGRSNTGETYVVFGRSFPSPAYTIDLDSQPADITVFGDDALDESGCAVASGDVNGDGYDDIIIGAHYADPGDPPRDFAGETYLISGGGAFITAHGLGGKSWIKEFSLLTNGLNSFKAFGGANSQGEVHLAVGDIDADILDEIAAGQGEGGKSWVKFFEVNGSPISGFKAFGASNTNGELHIALGNFDADAPEEIVIAQGEGGQSWVKLFNADGTFMQSFKAFGAANAQGEVHVAAGDFNEDGIDEIVVGMGEGGSSRVKIFESAWGFLLSSFKAFEAADNPGGEVRLAVGNFDADADLEIAVATGYNGGNKVRLFEKDGTLIKQFLAFGFGGNPNGDVQIAAADIDNDGIAEILCAHGEGGSSQVKVFQADGTFIRSFKAFGAINAQGEVHLARSNY